MREQITMREILKEKGTSKGLHRNSHITRLIAAELREQGYEVTVRKINGKSAKVWVLKDRIQKNTEKVKSLVSRALKKG